MRSSVELRSLVEMGLEVGGIEPVSLLNGHFLHFPLPPPWFFDYRLQK